MLPALIHYKTADIVNPSVATRFPFSRFVVFAAASWFTLGLAGPAGAQESLAHSVPADVGLFVEARGMGDLLTRLTDPQVWTTLAELAGQPAQAEDVAQWRQRVLQTVKMTPEEAIRVLFSQAVAFVGEGLGRSADAVVVCRPNHETSTAELLKRWGARRLRAPQRPATYRLYSNIGVSEYHGLLFFGDLIPSVGLLHRVQRFTAEAHAKALADDPVYMKLLARVPANPDGVLFARLERAAALPLPAVPPSSQPTARPSSQPTLRNLPGPLRNAENVMLALHRDGPLLRFTAVADTRSGEAQPAARPVRLVESLPERTLLAWQGRFDFAHGAELLLGALQHNPIEGVFQLQGQIESLDRFVQALDTDTCLAIGPVFPGQRPPETPPLPAVALLIGTRDPAGTLAATRDLVNIGMGGYILFAINRGLPLLQPIQETRLSGEPAFVLDLSPLLKPTARKAIGEIQLCWIVHKDTLIVASHLDWLRQIVAARDGQGETLAQTMRLFGGKAPSASVDALVIQSGPISDIASAWLDYLRRSKPEVLDENWWRDRQPGGNQVRLGIDVVGESAKRRLRVTRVLDNLPAAGRLEVGDYIVGYNNVRFTTDDLIAEITKAIRTRPRARRVELLIERAGVTQQIYLPLPFIDPTQALHRMVAIGRIAQRAVYRDDRSDPVGPRGLLTIELRTSEKPLFEFSEPVPIGSAGETAD
jgi:hypothetical protein